MSGEQEPKKGKRRRRNRSRGRGRGSQAQQSESVPGGLQQERSQESEGATAQSIAQPTPTPQPRQQAQAQAVSETRQERTTPEKQAKTKQQTWPPSVIAASPSKPLVESLSQPREQHKESERSKGVPPSQSTSSSKPQHFPSTTAETKPQPLIPPSKPDVESPKSFGEQSSARSKQKRGGKRKAAASPAQSSQLPTSTTPKQPQPSTTEPKPQASKPQSTPEGVSSKPPVEPLPGPSREKASQAQQAQPTGTKPKVKQPAQQLLSSSQSPPHSSKAEPRPLGRPDKGGTSGRPIKLRVNFYPVQLPKEDIHHYDTEIKAQGQKQGSGYTKSEAPRIIKVMVEQYERMFPDSPKLVYDRNGKNLYSRCPIPGIDKGTREFKVTFVTDTGREREFTVVVKWVSQVSLYDLHQALEGRLTEIPYHTMQAVEVALRHLSSMTSFRVGSSFFSYPDGTEKDLGFGLQVWNGTFVSIRPSQWKMMMVNVDTASSTFYKAQPVLDFMCQFLGLRDPRRGLQDWQRRKFEKEMKTVKVETTHVKRRQKVTGISKNSARNETFDCEGTKMSVFEYFRTKYHITLRYPDLPCLRLGPKAYFPIEVCKIVEGEHKQGKLTADQTREMIRHTAIPAPDRQRKINDLLRNLNYDQDPYCRDFGIKVSHEMARIGGRVLNPPVIAYGPEQRPAKETPKDGAWNMQHISYQPVELKEWAIISFENPQYLNDRGLGFFISKLVEAGRDKGLRIHPQPCHQSTQRGYQQIGRLFGQLKKDYPNLQLIIVIFPGKGSLDEYYEGVKHFGDVIYGINTQCIKANTAQRKAGDRQTMANICLKINAKLGGTTFIIDEAIRSPILNRPVIIFGADVTHPSPRDVKSPSIAAVVASMDLHPNLYSAEVRVQKHRQEMITELKDMVKALLCKFREQTKTKPEKILFYRDGVSEGQFKDVLINELQAIQRACYELHPNFRPGITFIVVQKRHHTRLFAEDPRDQRGKSKNVPAGTVVDQQVCHPFEFDWYLCSHFGIQGTSRPAHYHVLYDDNNFKSDDLQILTNQLCHTYVRCARAVSIPAPAYYAHHVAFRARYHLNEVDRGSSEGSQASGDAGVGLPPDEMIRAVQVHANMNKSMYFA